MQVLAIQNQSVNSSKGLKKEKAESLNLRTIGLSQDNFDSVSFKGEEGAVRGGLVGLFGGSVISALAILGTGGAALPVLVAAYWASITATTAAGAVVGHKIEERK